ncbi:MAG: NADPH-dependent assimilatory sulfite reductase hemoprotein subunit [Gemmatimonadaceae bacterium]|nr:NADPH-dependent assimilatory sulfite reductase hemoprotein subunit [Gemmatimonadaceae bacterium]
MTDGNEATPSTESAVERAKRESNQLRGTLADTLADPTQSHFGHDDAVLLKFHGSYQQDDRDTRQHRGEPTEKQYSFMIRVALPGGIISAEQYLAFDRIAEEYANGTLRLTTRQGIQYHGVIKGELKDTIASINAALATTISACGDVQRNVMACPAPLNDPAHRAVRAAAMAMSAALRPHSRAYHEIWLDGERMEIGAGLVEEPFYGVQYLPRKFKSVVALDTDNCVDAYSHDVALIAVTDGPEIRGFNVVVGGGLGMTHNKADTMAAMGEILGFVAEVDAVEAVKTVAAIYRDHGNRADRRHARVKYLLAEHGIGWFRERFRERVAFPLHTPEVMPAPSGHDHLGVHDADDGTQFYGVFIQSGRIADLESVRLRTAVRAIVEAVKPNVVITAQQNLLFTGLTPADVTTIEAILRDHGANAVDELIPLRRFSMACPALPTCGLAVAESERAIPGVLDEFEAEFRRLGIEDAPLTVRMTGCPNGCARPYTADVAFVGRSANLYQIYVGGAIAGDRVADLYLDKVPRASLVASMHPLLTRFAAERSTGESLGDFYQRISGPREPRRKVTGREIATAVGLGLSAS